MMASLIHREGMAGQVDMVYMDPPYNINFKSNFQGRINELNVGRGLGRVCRQIPPLSRRSGTTTSVVFTAIWTNC